MRHYYDLYKLFGVERVVQFIGRPDYETYKAEKLHGEDAKAFESRDPFTLPNAETSALFEKEFGAMNSLLAPGPSFQELAARIKGYGPATPPARSPRRASGGSAWRCP